MFERLSPACLTIDNREMIKEEMGRKNSINTNMGYVNPTYHVWGSCAPCERVYILVYTNTSINSIIEWEDGGKKDSV